MIRIFSGPAQNIVDASSRLVSWPRRGGWDEMQDEKVYFYATRGPDGEFASLAVLHSGMFRLAAVSIERLPGCILLV